MRPPEDPRIPALQDGEYVKSLGQSGTIIVRRRPFRACPLSEARALVRAFVFSAGPPVTYFAYLDEFGHIGPYISRQDSKHNDSLVFGLAGFILPSERVRRFGTWFFQRKRELLSSDIRKSQKYPDQWEKKGASLYTVRSIKNYQLRHFTQNQRSRRLYLLFWDSEDQAARCP